jgi:hypothetical protein
LHGYRRRGVRGAGYPVVLPERGATVKGIILDSVTAADRDRLSAYEGDGFVLVHGRAGPPGGTLRRVLFFKPRPGALTVIQRSWSTAGWRLLNKASKAKALAAARLVGK